MRIAEAVIQYIQVHVVLAQGVVGWLDYAGNTWLGRFRTMMRKVLCKVMV